jgi:ADP-ribose pyrophosphatase YjhB (NUDIX family)
VTKPKPRKRKRAIFYSMLRAVQDWLAGPGAGSWRSAGGVVVNRKGEVALIRQGKSWTFPKGRLEAGEAIHQAARREVREETGLRARITSYLGIVEGARHITHYFLMSLERDEGVHDEEVDEVRFFKPSKAKRQLHSRSDRLVLRRAVGVRDGKEPEHPVINP